MTKLALTWKPAYPARGNIYPSWHTFSVRRAGAKLKTRAVYRK